MHIGNARTALFNYLYARKRGGQFLIRIEDTDRERYSEEAVEVILDGLSWLGLEYDNTPESQFANKDRHIAVAHELLEQGKAYKCYCTAEELDEMRAEAKEQGRPVAYDGTWRDKEDEDAPDLPYVVRIKSPETGTARIEDKVQGVVEIENDHIDDFVLLRSDGTPTYMLAVVVDDHDMEVSHVIRGDDHLNNTFRQNVIYDAMGWDQPEYAHLPLIHGPDGKKFSKRHGAVGVEEFQKLGYLPEALCNYLLRLGWAHGDEEIIDRARALEIFDFTGIQKSPANFDYDKLESLNCHYMQIADDGRLVDLTIPFFDFDIDEDAKVRLEKAMPELKERNKTLVGLAEEAKFLVSDITDYSEKAQKQLNKTSKPVLTALKEKLQDLDDFEANTIETCARTLADEVTDGKLGKVMMPFRAALTGTDKSPSLFMASEILGRDEVVHRIQKAVEFIQ